MVNSKAFSAEGIVRFGNIFLGCLATSFPKPSPSPAGAETATKVFAPE
jgi:hypothetical protein